MGLILGVVGGRDFTNKDYLYTVLDIINKKKGIDMIVSGGARGC